MGADVNRKCELGNTALHQALMVGYKIDKNVKIINTLVLSGANNKLRNNFGQTPMYFACKRYIEENYTGKIPAFTVN